MLDRQSHLARTLESVTHTRDATCQAHPRRQGESGVNFGPNLQHSAIADERAQAIAFDFAPLDGARLLLRSGGGAAE